MSRRPVLAASVGVIALVGALTACKPASSTAPEPSDRTSTGSDPPATTIPAPTGDEIAAVVMSGLCRLTTIPEPDASAASAFFSVHDRLHELAGQLDDAGKREVAASVLQATAAVEAQVEGSSSSVPWHPATVQLVAAVHEGFVAQEIDAPAC